MARHAPCDRMDRVPDVDALLLEQLGELAHVVLRLRDRQPVAGDEHDPPRVGEHDRDVVRGRRADGRAVGAGRRCGRGRVDLAERAEEDVRDRPVHRLRHHQS